MIEFLPWSPATYNESILKYKTGRFSILDIQLSGQCNYNCIYCDTPDRDLPARIDFRHLEQLIQQEKGVFEWIFICGLGEPLWGDNRNMLIDLLKLSQRLGIKCSMFTNGSNFDDNILSFVSEGILYPMVKIDSFDKELSKTLYGVPLSSKTMRNIEDLFKIAKDSLEQYCPVAASIVPTAKNINEIPDIVRRCIEYRVFPMIGQLEYAGKAISNYDELLLTKDELISLKTEINRIIGEDYKIPICPSVIAGIHINSNGFVSVDRKSGLSCSWFWLETPETENLCNIKTISSLHDAEQMIINYRETVLLNIISLSTKIEEHPFGGCGGNLINLINDYIALGTK